MHVPLDHACTAENFATDRIAKNVRMEPLSQARSFWKFENAAVIYDARAHVAASKRNDPNPPAATKQMIGGPFTSDATTICVIGKAFSPFIAVPLLDAGESRPNRVDGMLRVLAKMPELPGKHGRAACSIDNPTASSSAFAKIDKNAHSLSVAIVQLAVC